MQLSHAQKQYFFENGFVRLAGVVPRVLVERARQAINASVGAGMNVADMSRFSAQSFCPELQTSPIITDLFHATPARPLAESMIGEARISHVGSGQIALRFPTLKDPPPKPSPHIDGVYTPANGVPKGELHNFTALVGCYLSDVPGEADGNLTCWPGTHRQNAAYFREHGVENFGLPPVALPAPFPITGSAGDVVIAHYLTAHGITQNVSANVRYAVFFRLHSTDFAETKWDSLRNEWLQWHGMREVVGTNPT